METTTADPVAAPRGTATAALRIHDIHVEVAGAGRPVLLIHGNSGNLHYFDRTAPELTRHFRVAAMDCRGQGRSARGEGPLTIQRMADDAADVIRAVGAPGERVDIVGFSDGANVAMALAVRHPELVGSLVLNSGNIDVAGMRVVFLGVLRIFLALLNLLPGVPPIIRERERIRLMVDEPGISAAQLAQISVPTLVLAGSRDVIRRTHTRMIAALIPDAQLRILLGGTHFALRGMPGIANAVIASFLRTGKAPLDHTRIVEK